MRSHSTLHNLRYRHTSSRNYRHILLVLIVACIYFFMHPLTASAQLPTPAYGLNLGNSLEPPSGIGSWGTPPTEALIRSVAKAGFNTIRIPCAWDSHANQTTYQIDPTYMAHVKQVVDWCYSRKLYVIINDHWDDGWLENHITGTVNPTINAKMKAYWTQIASNFAGYDNRLLFAAANEPDVDNAAKMSELMTYYQTFVDAVRGSGGKNRTRWLVVQGPGTNIEKSVDLMTSLPHDPTPGRMMVEVHFYAPYQFVMMDKDASWGKMWYFWGRDYHSASMPDRNATKFEEAYVDSEFQMMTDKFIKKGIPVVVGEFSAMKRKEGADLNGADWKLHIASTTYWDKYVVDSALRHGLAPMYWNIPDTLFDFKTGAILDPAAVRALTGGAALPPPASNVKSMEDPASATPAININVFNERHPISPYIYGGNFPKDNSFIEETGTRLSRWGGNDATSYNWKLHLRNICADWYFENFACEDCLAFVKKVEDAGSAAIVGIAMVDWAPKDGTSRSYSVAKYGPQQKTDPYRADAGNGMTPDGKPIQNDPNDAYVPLRDRPSPGDPPGTVYRSEWIQQLKATFGEHPHIYEFDNEPEIWNGTHRDIHPNPVTYAEMRDKFLQFGRLVKSIDPNAKTAGPVPCAWWFYWNSAAGQSDKAAHGGIDYLPWWLGQVADADRKSGQRTLDVFDIHAYSDANQNGTTEQVDASRIRSPRGMWDPTFRSEGGIGTSNDQTKTQPDPNATAIIPRFRAMVNGIYPGTKFAITEWSYGDDNNMSSSLADADTYGILGREKADLATRWESPQPNSLCSNALEMYKNFAPLSVQDQANISPDLFTSYAALSPDGHRLTVMSINKDPSQSVTANLNLTGFRPSTMVAYERVGGDKAITASATLPAVGTYTFKPYSQTLLVFQGSAAPGAVDWSIDRDDLMITTGEHAVLHVQTAGKRAAIHIVGIKAEPGVTMTARSSRVDAWHPAAIDVAAGTKPGFYSYTVTAKTPTGHTETQSGWIVVGAAGSLPTTATH